MVEERKIDFEEFVRASGKGKAPLDLSVYRTPSGIPGFDELVEGGLEKGSVSLLAGIPGSGKTTFALQFLHYGASQLDEPGLFIAFTESKESIYKHALGFGWDFQALERAKKFQLLQFKPHQFSGSFEDSGAIADEIRSMGAKRVAIDSITAYTLLFKDDYQKRESVVGFIEKLHDWKCTSMIVSEMPPMISETQEASIGFLSDSIIALHYSKPKMSLDRIHSLEILKMRGTRHSAKMVLFSFEKDGLRVHSIADARSG